MLNHQSHESAVNSIDGFDVSEDILTDSGDVFMSSPTSNGEVGSENHGTGYYFKNRYC
jgi:hypothetical protein